MGFIEMYGKELVALFVPFVTWFVNAIFKSKAKLTSAVPYDFTFLVDEPLLDKQGNQVKPTQTIAVRSHFITNEGKETTTNLEIIFNWRPPYLNVLPQRHFEILVTPDNKRHVLRFRAYP
jgi:hypothetical protein